MITVSKLRLLNTGLDLQGQGNLISCPVSVRASVVFVDSVVPVCVTCSVKHLNNGQWKVPISWGSQGQRQALWAQPNFLSQKKIQSSGPCRGHEVFTPLSVETVQVRYLFEILLCIPLQSRSSLALTLISPWLVLRLVDTCLMTRMRISIISFSVCVHVLTRGS